MEINEDIEDLQAEITELKQQIEAKHKAFIFLDDCRKEWHKSFMFKCEQLEYLKKKLARYENPDYVLVPRKPTNAMIGSGQRSGDDFLYHYQVSNVWVAMIEAVEKDDE